MCKNELTPEKWVFDLLQKRTLYLSGEMTGGRMPADFGKAMVWLNAMDVTSPITLYIDSGGGSVEAGLDMVDMIKHSNAPVHGIVYRRASSMALVVLQACARRQALPHAELLIHSVRVSDIRLCDLEDNFEKAIIRARKIQAEITRIYHERAGLSTRALERMYRRDKYITPEQALALNLIDEIIDK